MPLEKAKNDARALFAQITSATPFVRLVDVTRSKALTKSFDGQLGSKTPADFPIPELLLYGFETLLGIERYGPEEKMRWGVRFSYDGHVFAFEYRKFGLRVLCEPELLGLPVVNEIIGKARALTHIAQGYLLDYFIPAQLTADAITVRNLFSELRWTRVRQLRARQSATS